MILPTTVMNLIAEDAKQLLWAMSPDLSSDELGSAAVFVPSLVVPPPGRGPSGRKR